MSRQLQTTIRRPRLFAVALFVSVLLALPGATGAFAQGTLTGGSQQRYIVVLEDSVAHPTVAAANTVDAAGASDGSVDLVYRHALKGYSARLPQSAVAALRKDSRVKYVMRDQKVEAFAQTTPTGISRTFATADESLKINEEEDYSVDADVAVIDTGIDYEHPDLNVVARTDCVPPDGNDEEEECVDNSGEDGFGHGTHVAGIIGAEDNGFGVVGIAPGARLWAVRVLDSSGGGWESWILAGVDWVTAHASEIEVANMSLGCPCKMPALEEAIDASVEAGVVYVTAAGNEGRNAAEFSPANDPNTITVSALADSDGEPGGEGPGSCYNDYWQAEEPLNDDELADFSNWGSSVDVAAPGVCILSTVPLGGSVLSKSETAEYASVSGTSMAAPYVAGAAADLASESNPNSQEDVEAIREAIVEQGSQNWNDVSGDGEQEPLLQLGPHTELVYTIGAAKVSYKGAQLNGGLNPQGVETSYRFEYGTSTEYGETAPAAYAPAGSGTVDVKVSEQVEGLVPETTYHFRLVATSAEGVQYGADRQFTTSAPAPFHLFDVGERGSGPGQLFIPQDVAVDPEGDVWVADTGNRRIEEFSSEGELLTEFGEYGTGEGKLLSPVGVAVDSEGDVWVADKGNDRVDEFTSEGEFLGEIGEPGSGEGELGAPQGLAIDAEDGIWVTDSYDGQRTVAHFSPEGSLLSEFQLEYGIGEGKIVNLRSIALDPEGDVWLVDSYACRIKEFSPEGEFLGEFGEFGTDPGQMSTPMGVEIDADGNVWIADDWNDRVSEFTPEGDLMTEFGSPGKSEGQMILPFAVARDADGDLWVAEPNPSRLQKWSFRLPRVTTLAAGSLTSSKATLNATVDPEGLATSYRFEYGETDSYGTTAPMPSGELESGAEETTVSRRIEGLEPGTTYHFRIVASSNAGTSYGEDKTFTSVATYIAYANQFGSKGSGAGQFNIPNGIARDAKGNLWVLDRSNYRVDKFDSAGEFVLAFGKEVDATTKADVCTAASGDTCQAGAQGSANGQFKTPQGIAIAANGHVWVVDSFNNRVQEFSEAGEFLSAFGSSGGGNGQLKGPQGIAVDANGHIWVTDTLHRVQEFSEAGEFLKVVGSYGTAAGQFNHPTGIAIGLGGSLWVTDDNNHRVQKLDSAGEFVLALGKEVDATTSANVCTAASGDTCQAGKEGSGEGQFKHPNGVEVDPAGHVWVVDEGNGRVEELSEGGKYLGQFGSKGSGEGQFSFSALGNGIATDSAGNVWVVDPVNNRVQEWVVATYIAYANQFGSKGSGAGQFNIPNGIARDAKGNLWVLDRSNYRVDKFDSAGEFVLAFGKEVDATTKADVCTAASGDTCQAGAQGSANGQFKTPQGIAIAANGHVWVVDSFNNRVQEFSEAGEFLSAFGSSGGGNGQLKGPQGIAVDANGHIWVTDTLHRVQEFSEAGEFLKVVGSYGTAAGQFNHPTGIAIGLGGSLWVTDDNNHRVQKLDSAGEFVLALGKEVDATTSANVCTAASGDTCQAGKEGSGEGQFKHPNGVEVDPAGHVWVVDEGNGRVEELSEGGKYLGQFGSKGSGEGQFSFSALGNGIATDSAGNVWVVDPVNNRVQEWE